MKAMLKIRGIEALGLVSSLSGEGTPMAHRERIIDGLCSIFDGCITVITLGFVYSGMTLAYMAWRWRI